MSAKKKKNARKLHLNVRDFVLLHAMWLLHSFKLNSSVNLCFTEIDISNVKNLQRVGPNKLVVYD